jgi:hypothetical protein
MYSSVVLDARDMTEDRAWEFREKPAFEPGYFRLKLHPVADVLWFCVNPNDLDDLYERVEVTPVAV